MITPLVLQVVFHATQLALQCTYTVHNPNPQPVYLFNVLWRLSPKHEPVLDPVPVYISLNAEGELRLGKIIHPVPRLKAVEVANAPMVRKLGALSEWKETIELPYPIAEHSAYYPSLAEPSPANAEAQSVEFWIALIPETEDLDLKPGVIDGTFKLYHTKMMSLVQVIKSQKVPMTIPVIRRQERFERF